MSYPREDYSYSECAEMIECAGRWNNLDEWGESLGLSPDDVEWISPDLDDAGVVSVSLPMFDSLKCMGIERADR